MECQTWLRRDRIGRRTLIATTVSATFSGVSGAAHSDAATIQVGYLRWLEPRPTISLLDKSPSNNGLAGARLAMNDNNTTGRFMNQQFELSDAPVRDGDDPAAILTTLADRGVVLLLSDVPADRLLLLAEAGHAVQHRSRG